MDDSYLIKIESVVLSDGLLTDLANLIDKIYDEVKTSSSSLVDYTFKTKHGQETTIHTKEECSKQKIPKDLAEIKFKPNSRPPKPRKIEPSGILLSSFCNSIVSMATWIHCMSILYNRQTKA